MPHIRTAANVACAYGDRIVTRLDLIQEALQSEEFIEYHPRFTFVLVAGVPQDMPQVPTNEQWELEFVTGYAPALTPIITMRDGSIFYADTFTGAVVKHGVNVVLQAGTAPSIMAEVANATVTVQFKKRRQPPSQKSQATGLVQSPDVFNGQPMGERSGDGRHSNGAGTGRNSIGYRLGDGATIR